MTAIVMAVWFNPLSYVVEAGASAYYQARVAYTRGNAQGKAAIRGALADGKITQHEYTAVVFPQYLNTVNSGENVFPATEQAKAKEQLRVEALAAAAMPHAR